MPRPSYAHVIDGSGKVRLDKYDPRDTAGLDKAQGIALADKLGEELAELTNLLAYAGQQSLLVVVQGRDASGKDGVIRKVLTFANVLNAFVVPFKAPTAEELSHDFLWRIHAHTPARGQLALFNRSHYEDVIAVRVHDLVPREVWKARYDHINNFERLLVDSRTIVLKFYLHVSPEEQYERLLEREEDPRTAWKLNVNDWRELPLWKQTTRAYEDALERCSSPELPWNLVPADRKWFRNVAVFQRLVMALRPFKQEWLGVLKERRKQALKEIETLRQQVSKQLKPARRA
jgi:PPK2 family polyphosphate:nucleotide phosphotransferase